MLEDEADVLALGADVCLAKGPFKDTGAHILRIIEQIDNGTLHEFKGQILGGENLFKRHITSELLFSRRHYETIFNSMPDGVMEFAQDGTIFHANAAALALCDLREETLLGASFFDLFRRQHRERLRVLLDNSDQAPMLIAETAPIRLNGKMLTIHFLPSKDETHDFIIAIMRDISEKIKTTKELDRLRHQQVRLLNAVGEGIFGLDLDGRVTFANPAALAMLGYESQKLVGANLREIVHACAPSCQENDCPICAASQDGILRKGTETFWRKNGENFPVRYTCSPVVEDNEIMGSVVAFADITERRKMEEKLRESAMTDELTGLFNRRGFMALADKLIKMSVRDKTDLLLVYVDLDNLKWINDNLGHTVGDHALVEAATLLGDTFRLADVVGRMGGDEFVILCTDSSALGNEEIILARLSESLEKANRLTTRQYPLSLSVGVGRYEHLAPCSLDELLSRADQAMYENKKARRQDAYKL